MDISPLQDNPTYGVFVGFGILSCCLFAPFSPRPCGFLPSLWRRIHQKRSIAFDQPRIIFCLCFFLFRIFWVVVGIYPVRYVCWVVGSWGVWFGVPSVPLPEIGGFVSFGTGNDGCRAELCFGLVFIFVDWLVVCVGGVRQFD